MLSGIPLIGLIKYIDGIIDDYATITVLLLIKSSALD
jgi:hypothetical protein